MWPSSLQPLRTYTYEMKAPRVLVIAVGATAFLARGGLDDMHIAITADELVGSMQLDSNIKIKVNDMTYMRTGTRLKLDALCVLREAVCRALQSSAYDGYCLVIGTDTMDEAAFTLGLMLDSVLREQGACLAVTGAMKPADISGADGSSNLEDAIKVATDVTAQGWGSTMVVMNGAIHLARYVTKSDSQMLGAFASHPGPIGQVRGGAPHWYYSPPPGPSLSTKDFSRVEAEHLDKRVVIWTVAVSSVDPPPELLGSLSGLVLAAPGTGSLPPELVDALAPTWTSRLPIVISTRCATGSNCDDHYYRGSKAKYERRGFLLSGYEHLTALQARLLLIFRLAARQPLAGPDAL